MVGARGCAASCAAGMLLSARNAFIPPPRVYPPEGLSPLRDEGHGKLLALVWGFAPRAAGAGCVPVPGAGMHGARRKRSSGEGVGSKKKE